MKKIHILESTLRYLLDEGRNAEKAKQKTIAVMKNYLSQNGIQGEQLDAMAIEYEHSLKEWLFHANMPDSIIRLEPIMANVAMQLGFTPKDRDTEGLYRLKDITNYIIANYKNTDFPIALNKLTLDNTSFDSLNELFGSAIDASKGSWKPSNDGKPKPHYTVKRLDTFEEAHKYHRYTQNICYLKNESTWNDYTVHGKNAVYVLLRDGWEDIPAEHGKNTPYDDYGESMVFVIIRPDGNVAYSNTRWNHNTNGKGPIDVDQAFTENMDKISDMLQTDYRNVLRASDMCHDLTQKAEQLLQKGWKYDINKLFDKVRDLGENRQSISLGYWMNIIDMQKKLLSPNQWFNFIGKFSEGFARVADGERQQRWSFINTKGQQIGGWYAYVDNFEDGHAMVTSTEGLYSLIDTQGKRICDWYNYIANFTNGLAIVQNIEGAYAVINIQGQRISEWYANIKPFTKDGFAIVYDYDDNMSFINTEGQQICDWYDMVFKFENGYGRVRRNDMEMSFINTKGQQIGGWYQKIAPFTEGCAAVQRDDDKWSFINTNGKEICGWYDYVYTFIDGYARIANDGKWSIIDTNGQHVCGWYDDIRQLDDNVFMVGRNDEMAFINVKSKQASNWINCMDDEAEVIVNGKKYIWNRYGWLNDKGEKVNCPFLNTNESILNSSQLMHEALCKVIRNYLLYN